MTAPTPPVVSPRSAEPRPGGIRLGVTLVAIAVLVGTLAAAAILLTTRFQPEGLAYIPSGTPVVVELHPNMPDGQRQVLGTLLAKVPGLSAGAGVGDRVDAALDQLVRKASDGKHTYADVKPYAAGPIFIALPAIDAPGESAGETPERMLAVLAPQGSAGCPGLEGGAAVTIERYRDVDLRIQSGNVSAPVCAAPGNLILLGDPASVRAALDAKAAGRGVTADAPYDAASKAVPDERLAWLYMDGRAAARVAAAAAARASAQPSPATSAPAGLPADVPEWVASSIRFVSEGAIIETVMPDQRPAILAAASRSPGATVAPDALSAIAPILPASTIAAVELHQAGPLLAAMRTRAGSATTPGLPGTGGAGGLDRLGAIFSIVGGDAVLGSLDQAALVVTRQGSTVGGGVVLRATDPAGAKARLDQLRTLLALAAPGTGDSEYHGARILTIPLAGLLSPGSGGLPFGGTGTAPGAGGGTSPVTGLPAGLTLEVAAYQSFIVIGLGDGFVRAVIDTPAGSALADQSTYRTTIGLAGSSNFAQAYLDLPDLLDLTESRTSADDRSTLERDLRPYLAPVAAVAIGATSSGGLARSRVVLYVP